MEIRCLYSFPPNSPGIAPEQQVTCKSPGEPATERRWDKPEKISEPALCFFLLPLRRAAASCKATINRMNYLPEDESAVYHM